MGIIKFALKMLVKDKRKSIAFTMTMFFTVVTAFIFFNIINNPYLSDNTASTGGASFDEVSVPLATLISFGIILFSCFMLANANSLYLSHKTDDIAVMEAGGATFTSTAFYLVVQTTIMSVIASIPGIIVGTFAARYANSVMYHYLNINANVGVISSLAYRDTIATILSILGVVAILDAGYIHRHDLAYMLTQEVHNDVTTKGLYHLPDYLYIIIALGGLIMILTTPYGQTGFIFPCFFGSLGVTGCLFQVIPNLIGKLKPKIWINKKNMLISVSNLAYSLRRSSMLIILYCISTLMMIALMITCRDRPKEFITSIMAYIILLIMMSVSIMYKYSAEARGREKTFFNLYKLGYTRKQIKKVIALEVLGFYGLLVLLPMIYMIVLLYLFVSHQAVTITFAIVVFLAEVLPPIIMGIITYYSYGSIILKKVKGVL